MLALLVCLWLQAVDAAHLLEGYDRREISTGPLYSRGWTEGGVRWVEEFLPATLARVERRLGRSLGRPFRTVLVNGPGELDRIARALGADLAPHTAGVAFPARDLMLVRADVPPALHPSDPTMVTVTHEVAHLVLHGGPGANLPRWLDEGVAMWVSQGGLPPREESYLSLLARTGSLYRLRTLETTFPRQHLATSIAYQQSFLVVTFLVERHGEDGLREVLDRVGGGDSTWRAIHDVTGLAAEPFEEAFFGWVAARRSLPWALLSLFNVWSIAALLALAAIGRYLVKRRRLMARLDAEDAAEDADV